MKKLMVGVMSLVMGASLFAAGPSFVDKNQDEVCDTYVSRGNKTAYEAGINGNGQYRTNETQKGRSANGAQANRNNNNKGQHKNRESAPGNGKNRA